MQKLGERLGALQEALAGIEQTTLRPQSIKSLQNDAPAMLT